MNVPVRSIDGTSLACAVTLLVFWILVRIAMRLLAGSGWRWLLTPVSLLAAWGFWWSTLLCVDSLLETSSTWSHGLLALVAAVTYEVALTLYVDHRNSRPGLWHWIPLGLRLSLVVLLTFILMEPIVSHQEERSDQRHVAVLVDSSESMHLSDSPSVPGSNAGKASRKQTARRTLLDESSAGQPLLDRLESDFKVRLYEFADSPREVKLEDFRNGRPPSKQLTSADSFSTSSDWAQTTDMAAALSRVNDHLPLDELSGLIVVTDGNDHSRSDLRESVRGLARRQIPVHTVLVGDQTPISDAEVTTIQAPQQVFVGDSVAIRAPIKVDRLEGRSLQVRLVKDGKTLDQRVIEVLGNRHRQTMVFHHQPEQIGVHEYWVELAPVPGERITANNRLSTRVSVSEDRIRMLIVENRPRWEFRYLKNLFAGRDRSVQLQFVLLHPDRLAAVPAPPIMHASVNRTFDDCEATALPLNEEEWMKFDVIVLGDVSPDDLGTGVMRTLEKFIARRGGTLIVVSGRQHMPHAFAGTPLADALPVQLVGSEQEDAVSPDAAFYFRIAAGAESHVIVQQAIDPRESQAVWQSLPQLHWRHPASKAKAGATVLAYAGLARDRVHSLQDQQDRALVLWQRFGAGRVLQLTCDQTWRLRYGVGDQYHHQFWGQVLRWSIQDRLAAGTELVRIGTDRTLYHAGDTVTFRARMLDEDRDAVISNDSKATVYLNDEVVQQTLLTSQPQASGILTTAFDGLEKPGKYRIEVTGPTVDRLLRIEGKADESVSIDFAIEGPDSITEQSDMVADSAVPRQLADWTGGEVVSPTEANSILERLGPKTTFHREQWTMPLWNLWPVVITFLLLVCVEWTLRKSTGLI